jgi:hypothetical protein
MFVVSVKSYACWVFFSGFLAPSFSSSGEFSADVFRLCEFFVPTLYRKAVDEQSLVSLLKRL